MPTVRYTTVNGEVIAEKRSGVRRLYVPDPLGSTVALLDNTQTQTDTFAYWPYGEERSRTGTTPTPFRFVGTAGYYRDSPSRSYVRARTLATNRGRWLTRDRLRSAIGRNLYGYAAGNPATRIDRSGILAALAAGIPTHLPPIRWPNPDPPGYRNCYENCVDLREEKYYPRPIPPPDLRRIREECDAICSSLLRRICFLYGELWARELVCEASCQQGREAAQAMALAEYNNCVRQGRPRNECRQEETDLLNYIDELYRTCVAECRGTYSR